MKRILILVCLLCFALVGLRTFKPDPPPRPIEEKALPIQRSAVPLAPHEPINVPEEPDELRDWARERPDQALAWLPGAIADERRDAVVEMICARIAEYDPAQAVALAERYPTEGAHLLENLVHQWAEQNSTEAKAYALARPPGAGRDRLLSRVAYIEAKTNPADAAKLIAHFISPGEIQTEAALSVLHQWAQTDPGAASAWAAIFPSASLRHRAANEVAAAKILAPQK